ETRVRIVREGAAAKGMYCGDVQARFRLSQPTMSHHFRKLIGAGILVAHQEGKRHFYTVDGNFLERHGLRFLDVKGGWKA
ncbi:MAG: helix-turn-helix domain-containing protein, partial [bacterium]